MIQHDFKGAFLLGFWKNFQVAFGSSSESASYIVMETVHCWKKPRMPCNFVHQSLSLPHPNADERMLFKP